MTSTKSKLTVGAILAAFLSVGTAVAAQPEHASTARVPAKVSQINSVHTVPGLAGGFRVKRAG